MRRTFLALLALPLLSACMMGDNLPEQPRRVVFFTDTSSQLDGPAQAVVADAAALANRNPQAPVRVTGFADPDGNRARNEALSQTRAQNVAAALRAAGVAPSRIAVAGMGEVMLAGGPTGSRRVEIQVGP
jgi:outer membrane protein OmpA-like peptidoglycan-associated protein